MINFQISAENFLIIEIAVAISNLLLGINLGNFSNIITIIIEVS